MTYYDYQIQKHKNNNTLAKWFFIGGVILSIIFFVSMKIITIRSDFNQELLAITYILTGCLFLSVLVTAVALIAWITEYTWLRIFKNDIPS